ncbi:metallophosphoesterase [Salibaculum halophilum]|uniref:metallophosphoesterase n=1 Tax=Salibaculum halophilum TaxID=1914408 RepID=UPI000A1011E7|nr:metallophosphoesterase [Salibaculum halophilum]
MKALIIGDVHFDRWIEAERDPFAALTPEDWAGLDALFIAGDLSDKPRVRWKYAIRHLARHVDPGRIHIIPGNHDYYDFQIDRDDRLAEIAAGEGANLAQKAEIKVTDTRFLCCTLWTDFALRGDVPGSQVIARERMNDYRYIRHAKAKYRKVRPYEIVQIHQEHRAWLEDRMSRPHAGQTVLITHHCPHPELISAAPTELDPVYGSDLAAMIAHFQPDAWIFGHTHHRAEAREGATLIKNVSLGYPDEVTPGREGELLRRGLLGVDEDLRQVTAGP